MGGNYEKVYQYILFNLNGFFTLNLAGCNTKDNDDVKAQDVIIKYLNTYYTIDKNDIDTYGKIIAGSKDISKLNESTERANKKFKSPTPLMVQMIVNDIQIIVARPPNTAL